jgi:hypothetical protein
MLSRLRIFRIAEMPLLFAVAMILGMTLGSTTGTLGGDVERMGMVESTDHGVTWMFKGHAQFHAPTLNPVDPSAIVDNGLVVVYFFDLSSLATDTAVVYRSVATDPGGLDFTPPSPAFKFAGDLTDPFVLKLTGGKYRMYVNTIGAISSATSNDGFTFTLDAGDRTRAGGVPGAIQLPDGRVRLFVCGRGITSLISENALDFTEEPGVRIPVPLGSKITADPNPILCNDGKYRMTYKVRPSMVDDPLPDEVRIAESADAFSWTPSPASLAIGSVPTMIELPDGRLRIYYVDFQPDQPTGLFRYIQRAEITPDSSYLIGGFVRIGYVAATDRLNVVFGTKFASPVNGYENGHVYKEYTLDMQATGKSGILNEEAGDSGGLMVDNAYYYDVSMHPVGASEGWRVMKFDAVNWTSLSDISFPLDSPREGNGDMMIELINGQIDISSGYTSYGGPPPPDSGASTHHEFFTPDLTFLGKRILSDIPHIGGSSMIYVDSSFYFVTASAFTGDLIMMKYDKDWHYLDMKTLMQEAHWSTGLAFDAKRFYVAYLNTSQRTTPGFFPFYPNVHLAAFDRDWNLVDDVAVTSFVPSDSLFTGRPWVLQHGNRLYVSYDVVPLPEDLSKIEGLVSVYEIVETPSSVRSIPGVPGGFSLEQNYPNPFSASGGSAFGGNPTTTIAYTVGGAAALSRANLSGVEGHASANVRLAVYDVLGRQVAVLVNERKAPGTYEVTIDGSHLASGVYFYRLQAGGFVQTRKAVLIK